MTIIIKFNRLFSANMMYGRNHWRTKEYKAWIQEAGTELMIQRPKKLTGAYKLQIEAGRPDNRRRDADNLLKPVSDLLVRHRVVKDDSDAIETTARWVEGMDGMIIEIQEV